MSAQSTQSVKQSINFKIKEQNALRESQQSPLSYADKNKNVYVLFSPKSTANMQIQNSLLSPGRNMRSPPISYMKNEDTYLCRQNYQQQQNMKEKNQKFQQDVMTQPQKFSLFAT